MATAGCCMELLLASLIGSRKTQRLWPPVRNFCYTLSLVGFDSEGNYLLLQYSRSGLIIHKCNLPNSLLNFTSPRRDEIRSSIMATSSQTTWDDHRATITHLYAIKPLRRVRDEMKERHGFTATYGLLYPLVTLNPQHMSNWISDGSNGRTNYPSGALTRRTSNQPNTGLC